MKILFTNIGKRGYLLQYASDLCSQKFPIELYASDTSLYTSGFYNCEVTKIITPRVSDDEDIYITALHSQCLNYGIDLIIPLMDYELLPLARNIELFNKDGIEVLISEEPIIDLCLDKTRTYKFCLENGVNTPKTHFDLGLVDSFEFPLFMKKILGSGSVGNKVVYSSSGLADFIPGNDMLQDLVVGTEFTMNILNDLEGKYVHSSFCKKLSRNCGETDKAVSLFSDRFTKMAEDISALFKHKGIMDIDFIVDKDDACYFIDFNPRFGGLYPVVHHSGFNYLKYLLEIYKDGKATMMPEGREIALMKGYSINYFEMET